MFEQSLYNQPVPEQHQQQEGDLFANYEIRNWNYSKRIYQILAVSAVINIFGIAFLAQTEVLTARGCDSPFVGRVCQVLDTVYVGSLLLGTDRDYVDAVSDKVDQGDAEIPYIDVSGETAPLSYPEGYFQIANPEQFALLQQQAADPMAGFSNTTGGFTPNPTIGNDIIGTTPVVPKPNPSQDNGPDSLFSVAGDTSKTPKGSRKGNRRFGNTNKQAEDNTNTDNNVAKTDPTPEETPNATTTDPATGYELNKRPFKDLGNYVNDLLAKKQVNLDAPFALRAKGKLKKDGKLDPKTFTFDEVTTADAKMADVVKESIEAINDSGYLQYLEALSGKDFQLEIKQDDTTINAVVQSELESDTRAKSLKSSLDLMIGVAKMRKQGALADQNDKDDLLLLEGAKIETVGKRLVITFNVPKAVAQGMIQRKLQEQAADLKKENGTAQMKPNDNTAKK
ncbi:MAG: hypothetical protein H7070_07655 [Saprospiraceae bacterium]|nr:hypothetical protein [Pyrinomonadaceae bacterium]